MTAATAFTKQNNTPLTNSMEQSPS